MEEINSINNRIEKFLKLEGLTAIKFAEIMEIRSSNVTHFLKGRNKPNFDFISRFLLRFPNVNPDWFLNGIGNVYREDNKQDEKPFTMSSFTQNSLFPEDEFPDTKKDDLIVDEEINNDIPGNIVSSKQPDISIKTEIESVVDTEQTTEVRENDVKSDSVTPPISSNFQSKSPDTPSSCEDSVVKENLDSVTAQNQIQPSVLNESAPKEAQLVKIVMFYDDMTFVEYNPKS